MLASMFAPIPIHNNMNMASVPSMNLNIMGSLPSLGQISSMPSSFNNFGSVGLSLSSLTPSEQLSLLSNMQSVNALSSPHTQNRTFASQNLQSSGQQWNPSSLSNISITPGTTPRYVPVAQTSATASSFPGIVSLGSTAALTPGPAAARTLTSTTSASSSAQSMSNPFYSTSMHGNLGMVSTHSQISLASVAPSQPIFAQPALPQVWQQANDQPVSPNTPSWDRQSTRTTYVYADSPIASFGHLDKDAGSARDSHVDDDASDDDDEHSLEKRQQARHSSSALDQLIRTIKTSLARMDEMIAKPDVDNEYSAALSEIRSALCSASAKVTNSTISPLATLKKRKNLDDEANDSPSKRSRSDEEGEGEMETVSDDEGMEDEEEEDEEKGQNACKPCPLLEGVSKKPIKVLFVNVQRQYTVSKRETLRMSKEERERLIPVHVRIMGNAAKRQLYFVAKDICLLIHTRKGNVAKSIGQFREDEKVRMSVICPRSNGTVSTHILTALTLKGVKRLLTSSRSPLAPLVHKWILKQVDELFEEAQHNEPRRQLKKRDKISVSAPASQTVSPVTSNSTLSGQAIALDSHNGSHPFVTRSQPISPAQSYSTASVMPASASINAKLVALAQTNGTLGSNNTLYIPTSHEFSNSEVIFSHAEPLLSSIPSRIISPSSKAFNHTNMLDSHEVAKVDNRDLSKNGKMHLMIQDNDSRPVGDKGTPSSNLTTLLEAIQVRSDKAELGVRQS